MLKLDCCKPLMDYYLDNCAFTPEERKIIEMRRRGASLIEMSHKLQISESGISNRLRSIKEKMEELDDICPYF